MTEQDKLNAAFATGWDHGFMTMKHCSPREAAERFPAWTTSQIEYYLNGRDDGVRGDTWRLEQVRRAKAAA